METVNASYPGNRKHSIDTGGQCMAMKKNASILMALLSPALLASTASAQDAGQKSVDNGTDPSKLLTVAEAKYEYLDLMGGFGTGTLRLSYTQPFGEKQDYAVRLRVPLTYVDVLGNDSYDLGDASIEATHVFGLSRQGAFVAKGELVFDTAGRPELGTGQNVFKGTFIYARFLKGGSIFAPAIVQSNSLWGNDDRAEVNFTTFDFYYVPKMKDPRNLVTFDPSLNFDWENHKRFAGLAVSFGRVLGPQLGGNGIVFVKPSLFAGSERSGDWGMEVGYKVIGF